MITAGVDLGIENVKVVILKDGKIAAKSTASSGGADRGLSAERAWKEALAAAKLKPSDVSKVVATGQGKYEVKFAAENAVEPVADTKAALFLFPSARSVVDIGADQVRAANFNAKGNIQDTVMNLKCAAGLGVFLRSMARTMEITLDEMSQLKGKPSSNISVNDRCAVFAELDVVWMMLEKTPRADIVQAINEAVATKINSVLNEKLVLDKKVVLFGGVAKNAGVINALKKRSGLNFMIPEEPEYGGAIGAALIAAS